MKINKKETEVAHFTKHKLPKQQLFPNFVCSSILVSLCHNLYDIDQFLKGSIDVLI